MSMGRPATKDDPYGQLKEVGTDRTVKVLRTADEIRKAVVMRDSLLDKQAELEVQLENILKELRGQDALLTTLKANLIHAAIGE